MTDKPKIRFLSLNARPLGMYPLRGGEAGIGTYRKALLSSDRDDRREARPTPALSVRELVENVTQRAREYTLYFCDLEEI